MAAVSLAGMTSLVGLDRKRRDPVKAMKLGAMAVLCAAAAFGHELDNVPAFCHAEEEGYDLHDYNMLRDADDWLQAGPQRTDQGQAAA